MSNYWADRLSAGQPPAEQPQSLGDQYREWQSGKMGGNGSSGSLMYSLPLTSEQRAAARPQVFEPVQYSGLEGYMHARPSKFEQTPTESDFGFLKRVGSDATMHHMSEMFPADEFARVQAAVDAAKARLDGTAPSHDQVRAQIEGRSTGSGVGIMGSSTPQDRAALVGRFGGRVIDGQGHVTTEALAAMTPLSSVEAFAIARQREAEQRGLIPQRTQAPTGSSGDGWHIQ
jgi:hypothetical protein